MKQIEAKGNIIYSFKDREIDFSQPIRVYRNLTKKDINGRKVYSIRQKGKTVAHATNLTLVNVKFIVNEKTRDRIRLNRKKEVHAFIEGEISLEGCMGTHALRENDYKYDKLPAEIKYNPYLNDTFVCSNLCNREIQIKGAMGVLINKHGITGAYTY